MNNSELTFLVTIKLDENLAGFLTRDELKAQIWAKLLKSIESDGQIKTVRLLIDRTMAKYQA